VVVVTVLIFLFFHVGNMGRKCAIKKREENVENRKDQKPGQPEI
jgi:hypothetical protein